MAILRDAIVLLVISCIAATVVGQSYDGLPRPNNFPAAPTTSYGPEPKVTFASGYPVDCTWYGFASELYDASIGETCLEDLRAVVLNATAFTFEPFTYYVQQGPTGVDPATGEPFCTQGCFNLDGGALPPDTDVFPPSYFDNPAPAPDSYLRGPSLAPFFWPGAPPEENLAPPVAPFFWPGAPPEDNLTPPVAPFFWPGAPPEDNFAPPFAPPPASGE